MTLEDRKKNRYLFLHELYKASDGNSSYTFLMRDIADDLQINESEAKTIVEYLKHEGLIAPRGLGGAIAISHDGIKEVEKSLENPDKPTYYFPPVNIINIENMSNSAIQQNTSNSIQEQNITIAHSNDELKEFLNDIKVHLTELNKHLSEDDIEDLKADITKLERQLNNDEPDKSRIKYILSGISNILKNIGINVVSNIVTNPDLITAVVSQL